ncbi:hypothetical protein WJX75_000656 [Coccomyxa subellipsoidea]|uniref:Expansin-like EG45 domain-containing protein n=1 Tax=Coccomyxa subellipsoidea TaxID=248742 RepID=A0ABR2YQN4_9CHLO
MHSLELICCVLVLLSVAASGAADLPTQGFATQYGGRQDRNDPNTPIYGLIDGACGYGAIPRTSWPYWQVAALGFSNSVSVSGSPQKWGCGACIQVTCTGSGCASTDPFVVLVTDTCKSCSANQININALTYNKYISPTNGQLAVSWQKVPCAPTGNIVARVTAASGSYLRLVLLEVGGSDGVKSVEVSKSGSGSWIKMDTAWGANFQTSSAPSPPLDLRITPNDGSAPLVATGAIPAAATGDYDTGVQLGFPATAATNATAAAPGAAGNATMPYLGPPVGPQQIPAVATANATAAPANATAVPVNATPAAPAPVAAANATAAPAVAAAAVPVVPASAATNFTTLTLPAPDVAQSPLSTKSAVAGQPATPPSTTTAAPSPAAAKTPAATSTSPAASPPQAAAISTGSAPAPVSQASGNTNQPFSLNFDRTTTNVTGGSTAAAPSIDSAVQQILNPKVNYSSGGRRLA